MGTEGARLRRHRETTHQSLRRIARSLIGRGSGIAAILIVVLAARATAAPVDGVGEPAAETPAGPSLLERYNRMIFSMNGFIYRQIARIEPNSDPVATELAAGAVASGNVGNVVSNLVNEPLSAMASVIIGDRPGMTRAVERFSINSTAGLFGYYDRATDFGLPAEQRDLGLAFCARGVPAGPFIMLGFVGPRTLRDAFVDVVLINLTMYSVAAAVFGAGTGLATVVAVESFEVVLDVVAARQIDTRAKALEYSDFNAMRDRYLQQRAERCAALVQLMRR
ncbi:MAG TPA: MlaA family lipoprotein [Stellaceae bacterium]|jgi:phospholipid-binding lipoprotein MlaA|nr:MlaA family lipoprotein [Stellaceae bacterium]